MDAGLTELQAAVRDAFKEAAITGTAPPTLRELCARFGWGSTGTARDHLKALVRKGVLQSEGGARGYRLVQSTPHVRSVPILGRVAAGRPILAVEHQDGEVVVPNAWVRSGDAFAVHVEGESMTGAGILDGDVIVARATRTARDRDLVVARQGDSVTVKRLRLQKRRAVLAPENPRFKDVHVDEDTEIVGVVVGLIRDIAHKRLSGGTPWRR